MRARNEATIADVAAASGVGVGTVSRVINNAEHVRAATRLKVLKAIEQLGYRPSQLAAALSRGRPRTVAIVIPHLTRPSAVERLAGALSVLDEHGYDTVVCNVDSPAQRDHHLAALTARHRAAGVIIVSLPLRRRQVAEFRTAAIPLVAVDVSLPGRPHTIIDDVAGGELATRHLMSLGHRRIGFVGDKLPRKKAATLGFGASDRRLAGYQRALTAAGIPAEADLIRLGPHGPANAEALAAELLSQPEPPSAIFAASDTQAMGVLAAAERLGMPIPGQLSVVGFDDIQAAELLGLSTVRQPLEDSGAMGAQRLCAIMRGDEIRPLRQLLPLQVVQRHSSARFSPRPGFGAAERDAKPLPATAALGARPWS